MHFARLYPVATAATQHAAINPEKNDGTSYLQAGKNHAVHGSRSSL